MIIADITHPVNGDHNWYTFSQNFTAFITGSTTLTFNTTEGSNNGGIILDAVSVNAVPLPPSILLLGSGLAGLGLLRRRLGFKA